MAIVIAVAIAGVVMLAIAIFTGNTIVASVVIALAALGLLLLARDWRRERRQSDPGATAANDESAAQAKRGPDPETFQPDPWDDEAAEGEADADYPEDDDHVG